MNRITDISLYDDMSLDGDLVVSGALTANSFPFESLSNVGSQSFENILDNGDFKLWSSGDSSLPDAFSALVGAGASISKSTTKAYGLFSAALTNQDATALELYSDDLLDATYMEGRTYTVGALVKASVAGRVKITIHPGSGLAHSNYHSGGDDWELLTVSKTFSSPAQFKIDAVIEAGDSTTVYLDTIMVVEGSICPAFSPKPLTDPSTYGEAYISNNSTATVIETADTPIAIRQISEGLNNGFVFDAGSAGGISSFDDYGGTVAGAVGVVSASHGLSTGDIITIRGTTNYNGIFSITTINTNYFYIMDTWVADDGASDWDQGASLTAQPGADGVYDATWQMTAAPAGACRAIFFININTTPQVKSGAPRELAINDEDNNSSTCLLEIVEGDVIWLSVQSDSVTDITHTYGNINIGRKP